VRICAPFLLAAAMAGSPSGQLAAQPGDGVGPSRASSGASSGASSAASSATALDPAVTRAIDRLFAPFARDSRPGYAVAVLRDGRPAYWRGYGMANLDELAPITPATAFNVASLSKQFTAACLALTILDGKVRLDDTAAAYVPALAKYHAGGRPPILVKHLVYMTSGLPDYYTVRASTAARGAPTTSSRSTTPSRRRSRPTRSRSGRARGGTTAT
jgi:CubicO group peptidase (beta-lactamase class C family)